MVITYVDGADPAHGARRARARQVLEASGPAESEGYVPERPVWYAGLGEIRYGVRSALRFMPWLRHIHIVTDGQTPPVDATLLDSGRVRIVDHGAIMPDGFRPAFDSTVIESFLHRIEGLSDIFLYNNDDMLHAAPIAPEEFVSIRPDGTTCLHLREVPAWWRLALAGLSALAPPGLPRANTYTSGIANSCRLLRRAYGLPLADLLYPRHVTQVYRRATGLRIEAELAAPLAEARRRHFRNHRQLSWSTLAYSLEARWHGAARVWDHPFSPLRHEALFLDLMRFAGRRRAAAWRRVSQSRAKFLCLNNIPAEDGPALIAAMAQLGLAEPEAA